MNLNRSDFIAFRLLVIKMSEIFYELFPDLVGGFILHKKLIFHYGFFIIFWNLREYPFLAILKFLVRKSFSILVSVFKTFGI